MTGTSAQTMEERAEGAAAVDAARAKVAAVADGAEWMREAAKEIMREVWGDCPTDLDSEVISQFAEIIARHAPSPNRTQDGYEASGWRPIDTAPKDGTVIIVHGGIAHWHNGQWKTLTAEAYPGKEIQWPVTHWQPLPSPPGEKSTTRYEAIDRQRARSVLQDWVMALSMMQQSVLLTALRGPDGVAKDHISKMVVRWLRRCVLLSAFDRVPLTDPMDPRGGSFTGPSLDPNVRWDETSTWAKLMMEYVVSPYIRSCDELPHHFQSHIRNAAEVLGYKHPDPTIREFWFAFYLRIAKDAHLNPETEEQMDFRLGDNREQWIAAGDISSCGREECGQ